MSGVNWIRAKSSPRTLANDRAMSVLPKPGEVLQEDVAASQDADEDEFEAAPSPHHGPVDLVQDAGAELCRFVRGTRAAQSCASHSCSSLCTSRASVRGGMPAALRSGFGRAGSTQAHRSRSLRLAHSTRRAASGSAYRLTPWRSESRAARRCSRWRRRPNW